jgi:chromosome partitioning protein
MTQFLAVSNRKGGVGKSTVSVMLAHAAASWGRQRVLVMDLDTQCNVSLMLVGGEGWEKASRAGHTIADYFYDRFEKVAEDESAYVLNNVCDVAH